MCKRPTKSPNSLILGMSKLCAHHHLMFLVNEKNCSILVDIILEWGLIFLSLYWAISILHHNSKFGVRSIAYYAILLRFLRNRASHQEFAKTHFREKLCTWWVEDCLFCLWCLQWLPSHASDFISNASTVLKLSENKTCLKNGKLAKKRMLKEVTPCAKQSEFSETRCLGFEGNYWATTIT
jgi:hypothetical protein